MSKLDYIDALKRALTGLPPETIAKTLAYYEQRYIDGLVAGRSDAEIVADLGEPKKIALTLRTSTHMKAFEQKKTPFNLLRLLASIIGLTVFNLFMVVPAVVYAALLSALYIAALAFYVAGIAITASGLSGANELVLDGPLRHLIVLDDDGDGDGGEKQTKISISESGINIYQEPARAQHGDEAEAAGDTDSDVDGDDKSTSRVIRQAERLAGGVRISTDIGKGSRTTQAIFGMGIVIGGIALFLLSLVISRYTLVGLKRYIAMNLALLKGH